MSWSSPQPWSEDQMTFPKKPQKGAFARRPVRNTEVFETRFPSDVVDSHSLISHGHRFGFGGFFVFSIRVNNSGVPPVVPPRNRYMLHVASMHGDAHLYLEHRRVFAMEDGKLLSMLKVFQCYFSLSEDEQRSEDCAKTLQNRCGDQFNEDDFTDLVEYDLTQAESYVPAIVHRLWVTAWDDAGLEMSCKIVVDGQEFDALWNPTMDQRVYGPEAVDQKILGSE